MPPEIQLLILRRLTTTTPAHFSKLTSTSADRTPTSEISTRDLPNSVALSGD